MSDAFTELFVAFGKVCAVMNEQKPNWPDWSTRQREIEVLRDALHRMARAMMEQRRMPDFWDGTEQGVVDFFVAAARTEEAE